MYVLGVLVGLDGFNMALKGISSLGGKPGVYSFFGTDVIMAAEAEAYDGVWTCCFGVASERRDW